MKLLLDTHCWLWLGLEPKRLGRKTRALLTDLANETHLSVASVWEIVLKDARGKLRLPMQAATYVRTRLRISQTIPLGVTLDHVLAVGQLPDIHRDPFDRLLVAQAHVENMTIVTADRRIARYNVLVHDAGS
ncbi:MAG TPA: type II toxin-antitoxin system VapC family toxin [Candidatus Dormibacteraeota bacterium]|nr:type II toxin-antitoxin system VapC family toxin [Candidatus Dormibacteraeota bacterium]